jgi:GH18 family chitinase
MLARAIEDGKGNRPMGYDDPDSLLAKAAYVQRAGLGGIMFWELSSDTSEHALLDAITGQLNAH